MSEKILIIDTSTEACSVAITHGEALYHQQDVTPRSHTKMVLPMVDAMLNKANLTLKELDAIAWGRGPGSFTGVRIGTGIMQGLALGANKPVIGISTLATMAQQAMDEHGATDVIAAIDARMNEVYWGVFKNIEGIATLVGQEMVVKPEAIDNAALEDTQYMAVGTAWSAYPALKDIANIEVNTDILYPSSHAMAPLAKAQFRLGHAVDVDDASPVYVRDTVTWQKLPGRN